MPLWNPSNHHRDQGGSAVLWSICEKPWCSDGQSTNPANALVRTPHTTSQHGGTPWLRTTQWYRRLSFRESDPPGSRWLKAHDVAWTKERYHGNTFLTLASALPSMALASHWRGRAGRENCQRDRSSRTVFGLLRKREPGRGGRSKGEQKRLQTKNAYKLNWRVTCRSYNLFSRSSSSGCCCGQ
jgi:hypothetical protein